MSQQRRRKVERETPEYAGMVRRIIAGRAVEWAETAMRSTSPSWSRCASS